METGANCFLWSAYNAFRKCTQQQTTKIWWNSIKSEKNSLLICLKSSMGFKIIYFGCKYCLNHKSQNYHVYSFIMTGIWIQSKIALIYQDFTWLNLFPHTVIIWFGCRRNVLHSCEAVTKIWYYSRKSRSLKELINNESCDFKLHALPT